MYSSKSGTIGRQNMRFFNIQMAAQISGLTTHTIRAWEKRYNALTPGRSKTGRRQYKTEEIERLSLLSQLTNLGNSIGQIAHLPSEELQSIFDMLTDSQKRVQDTIKKNKDELNIEVTHQNLLMALAGYKVDIISHELNKAKEGLSARKFALDIMAPLLQEVQNRQNSKILNVAQVQTLYAIMKFHAGNVIYSYYEKKLRSRHKVALATPEGEMYLFNILIGALLCAHHEKNFFFLSSNLQAPAVIEAVNAIDANILILGSHELDHLKRALPYYVEEVSSTLGDKCQIWIVGESGFTEGQLIRRGNVRVFSNYQELDLVLENLS